MISNVIKANKLQNDMIKWKEERGNHIGIKTEKESHYGNKAFKKTNGRTTKLQVFLKELLQFLLMHAKPIQ